MARNPLGLINIINQINSQASRPVQLFSATQGSPQPISTNTNTTIIYDSVITDLNSGYNNATGIYTIPSGQNGLYFYQCGVRLGSTGTVDGSRLLASFVVGGSQITFSSKFYSANNQFVDAWTSGFCPAADGDELRVDGFHDHGVSVDTNTSAATTYFKLTYFG